MRRLVMMALAAAAGTVASAQSFSIGQEHVNIVYPLDQVGEIVFGADAFTFAGRSYDKSGAYTMAYSEAGVKDNTVMVSYNGATAEVSVAGNIADKVSAKVCGAHVTLLQAESVAEEITYVLKGRTDNGSLYMDGHFKATFVFDGVNITNPDSAAVNIQDGKRVAVVLNAGTVNTLTDGVKTAGASGDAHNACMFVNGHTEVEGAGALVVNANVKHGITSDEYLQVKKSTGSITIASAPGDGLHVGQYYKQSGGVVSVTCTGDGVDVGAKKDPLTEDNGKIFIEGGQIAISTSGDATKGMKCDDAMEISGGVVDITVSGKAYYDAAEYDITSSAGLKPGKTFTMTDGTVSVLATGIGGKGLNAGGAVTIDGGKLTAVTCGGVYAYGMDDTKPQGVKSDGNITVNGGEVYVAASKDKGTAFKTDYSLIINGGTLMGIGSKSVSAAAASKQASKKYTSQNIAAGATVTYDGVSFTVPMEYSNPAAYVIVSKP